MASFGLPVTSALAIFITGKGVGSNQKKYLEQSLQVIPNRFTFFGTAALSSQQKQNEAKAEQALSRGPKAFEF